MSGPEGVVLALVAAGEPGYAPVLAQRAEFLTVRSLCT